MHKQKICQCICGCKKTHTRETKKCSACQNSFYRHGECQGIQRKPKNVGMVEWWLSPDKWTLDIETGCWLSNASNTKGYARVYDAILPRLILEQKLGRKLKEYPEEVTRHLCHHGDEGCINPDHLKAGTSQENADDKVQANRQIKGDQCNLSTLTQVDVDLIRDHYFPQGYSYRQIGDMYGVYPLTIKRVVCNETWRETI